MSKPQQANGPPDPPPMKTRPRFGTVQLIGLILLMLLPLAALAGVFGESWAYEEASTSDLHVRMRYPDRYRYKQINSFEIFVQNTSPEMIDTITVAFDTAYVLNFSNPVFVPATSEAFVVPLTAVKPGQTRLVTIELQAEHYWLHRGEVRVTSGGVDTATVPVQTFVFP